jgi:hypothetical protein
MSQTWEFLLEILMDFYHFPQQPKKQLNSIHNRQETSEIMQQALRLRLVVTTTIGFYH